jgi:hypothetical protein
MKFNQAAWNWQQAEIKWEFVSNHVHAVGDGVYLSCGTGLSSRYMIMGVEVSCLTGLKEIDEAKQKE